MYNQNAIIPVINPDNLNLILNELLQGIICIDVQGIVRTFNRASEKILGIKKETALNQHFSKVFNDHLFGFSIEKTLHNKEPGKFKKIISYIRQENQKNLTLEITTRFIQNFLIILIHDVTEIKETENLLHANNRLKDLGAMTALLAHEIRNPLGGIKGFASLLKKDVADQSHLKHMIDLIIDGTDHLNRLVTHILNFAHPFQINLQNIDLNELGLKLKQTIEVDENFKKLLENITFEMKPTHLYLNGDKELLTSALLNLLINGMQAMPQGGNLTLLFEDLEKEIKIQVVDTGIGISKENLGKLFSAFFTTKKDGNGFGLLEVYKVISAHKGTIDVESEVNSGTCFTIKIPK